MSGEAVTGRFMLGTATVMVGPQANLQSLGVAQSLGMMKNVTFKGSPKFTDLSQGVKNSLIAQVMTGNDLMMDAEMFEYTAANLAYAMGLDGSAYTQTAVATTATAALAAPTAPALTSAVLALTSAIGIVVGQWLAIHVNPLDQIFVRKVVSVSGLNVTVSSGLPVGLPLGAKVEVVNMVPAGSRLDQPYLCAKVVGQLADSSWITVLVAKVRVTSGLSLAFKTDSFDHMPLQLTCFDLLPTDANYSLFQDAVTGDVVKAMIFSTPTA